MGRANVPGNTVNRTFSATELTPFTNYTFQVAGVNDVGTGPLTDIITITTDEEGFLNLSPHARAVGAGAAGEAIASPLFAQI